MPSPTRLRTLAQFQMAIDSGAGLVVTDSARHKGMFHPNPGSCMHIWTEGFEQKVIENAERNGSYFVVDSLTAAREHWPRIRSCKTCSGASGAFEGDGDPLLTRLREATGLAEVRPRNDEPVGAEVLLDKSTNSTQRIALGRKGDSFVLASWPGELKPQAEALYMSDRSERLLQLVNVNSPWLARPKPHLAYFASTVDQRIYFSCSLSLDEYMRRWSEREYMDQVREHPGDTLREGIWSWLQEHGIADPELTSEGWLDEFIARLGKRKAHLRPGIEIERAWPVSAVGQTGPSADEVGAAVGELLTTLREPLPPALGPQQRS